MRPILIYFKETHLDENNKFTLDFSDQELVQQIEFLSGTAYLCDIDCLKLISEWYIKYSSYIYGFKLDPNIIDNYSYKYKFWDTI